MILVIDQAGSKVRLVENISCNSSFFNANIDKTNLREAGLKTPSILISMFSVRLMILFRLNYKSSSGLCLIGFSERYLME